ncbi:MAG: trehalose synthase [Verrucomicrobiales bacterium]|nr:trehalose synthase [Verrucomicrobiales bacterium]
MVTSEKDPLWYQNAIIYELHVRAFHDSNGDGIGDFPGLTQKLDYLHDLGVTAIWLLPFYPSPLKDDGYDIADYYSINPMYGTLEDFKVLLREAHARGLRVITELVVNHTSDQHPWFQRARRAPVGSEARDYYVWSASTDKYKEARIIFKDFEPSNWAWDPVAQSYFWHRFYSHQPDLNYDNLAVHREITKVLDFWLDLGVDGLRLDAVPYLYERDGTYCENLQETHEYLKTLRAHIDSKYGDRMLLAEANQWPEEAVTYFGQGNGDECHMAFHFPLMPRLFMALRMEDRVPIVDILDQTPSIPETSQWALFLRNHDELTLEMVTDEERDYMYRVYANDLRARINLGIRRRLAPLLGNDRKKIELLNLLLFSLPGTPVLYYGDEIGMGDNTFLGDRNGVRTPMQWNSDKNAGFSRANPHALFLPVLQDPEYHYETVNVEAQQGNPNSLLWWTKRVLALRKRWKAFGKGSLEFLQPSNRKILAFIRECEGERILVVVNLSRFPQPVELDLSRFKDYVPLELFGRTEFPLIKDKLYLLTLSPHAAFWFSLEPKRIAQITGQGAGGRQLEPLLVSDSWEEVTSGRGRAQLESRLPAYLHERRWFGGKTREIKSVHIRDSIQVPFDSQKASLLVLLVDYVQGDPEEYILPLAFADRKEAAKIQARSPQLVVAPLRTAKGVDGILYDASGQQEFGAALLEGINRGRRFPGMEGELEAGCNQAFAGLKPATEELPKPSMGKAEQSNTSILFGDRFFLKLFRRLEPGTNPDLEIGRFLTNCNFPNVPPVVGWLEYRRLNSEQFSFGILSGLVPNSKDAWPYTLDMLGRFFERVRTLPPNSKGKLIEKASLLNLASREVPDAVSDLVGTFLELALILGQRTGELHLALASDTENRDFAPEPFTPFYQRALFQSMRNLVVQNVQLLRTKLETLPAEVQPFAEKAITSQAALLEQFKRVSEKPLRAMRIRCHGDYHLGQVLYTGKDFMIIDFEGEPARPLGERRIKRSPLRDVAGMIRSFDYATYAALHQQLELGNLHEDHLKEIEPWTHFWYQWSSAAFLKAYLKTVDGSALLPQSRDDLGTLLRAHLLEKAIYEIGYELNNRPTWVKIPIQGVVQLLEEGKSE